MSREFDSPWKESLELLLEPFLLFFFPHLHAAIDWSRGYESLDNELHEILREAESEKKIVDKLFRVFLLDGQDVWLLIHLEVQAQYDADFEKRMFVSYYRIFDRYNRDVVSIAVLGDDRANWRPNEFRKSCFETEISLRFSTIKLLDWAGRIAELETSTNPMALIVVSHLESLATHNEPLLRFDAKWRLTQRLYKLGWTEEQLRQMNRLVDWFLELPEELQQQLQYQVVALEKETAMSYVTSWERMAEKRGRNEGEMETLLRLTRITLNERFGEEGRAFAEELSAVSNLDKLREIGEAALRNNSKIDDLRAML